MALGGGINEQEAEARAINAQPWEPPPGMIKLRCPRCRYFFAASADADANAVCPDCVADGSRPLRLREPE